MKKNIAASYIAHILHFFAYEPHFASMGAPPSKHP